MGCVRGQVQRESGSCQACWHARPPPASATWFPLPPNTLQVGRPKRRKQSCAHIPGLHESPIRRVWRTAQECSGNLNSQKATGWGCGTLGLESETVCVNSATFLCQPSVLRQREKSGWRVCNTDHTGSGWRASAPAENPAFPVSVVSERPASQGSLEFLHD